MAHMSVLRSQRRAGRRLRTCALLCASMLPSVTALAQTAPAPPPPTPVAFEEALLKAANTLFSKADLQGAPERIPLVIDPLIDGFTGAQSIATTAMQRKIEDLVKTSYRRFEVTRLTTESVANLPVVLIGTFTAINNAGVAGGARDVYRICLALADLRTRKIISKGATRALPEGIDATPTAFFGDSPALVKDPATDTYIKSCQGTKLGDSLDQAYSDRIQVAVHVNDAIEAYNAKKYAEALGHFEKARRIPGGDQLRVLNGVYLANWKLDRSDAARQAFGRIVDYGLNSDRLSVKFLFRPNAAQFASGRDVNREYSMWLRQIAKRTADANKCLDVVGHTSASGPADVNERLSLQRAAYVKERMQVISPRVNAARFVAKGVGARELIVGTGKDDASDALDRRVEFKPTACSLPTAENKKIDKTTRPTRASHKSSARSRRSTEDGEYQKYFDSAGLGAFLKE